ncbi:hypothetical protein VOI32_03075 [Paraburkholderia caribensis]|uniref:Uncharacterized protein n=2 Tax=Paraburkholderia caribensis TaxID=75105 RepID=A0ABV0DPB8_9BURK|nr:hypothetical protein [Paraburkholderia caribensis]MCO4882981.1 hypothetical protein [Paraburkholderia caribensis]
MSTPTRAPGATPPPTPTPAPAPPPTAVPPGPPTGWAAVNDPGTPPTDRLYIRTQLFTARMKAHDVLLEHLKQTVTIASATLALTIGFIKDILGPATGMLHAEILLKISWGALGTAILLAIYVLATLVNHLDSAGIDANKAFKAGDNRAQQLITLGTFLIFGVGMLSLGLFAAFNYDNVVHRKPQDFAIGSATMAIEAAKKATPSTQNIGRVTSVELIPGVGESAGAVWHVVLETVGTPPSTTSPASAPIVASPVRAPRSATTSAHKRKQATHKTVQVINTTPPSPSRVPRRVDYYIDAKTGDVTAQP